MLAHQDKLAVNEIAGTPGCDLRKDDKQWTSEHTWHKGWNMLEHKFDILQDWA